MVGVYEFLNRAFAFCTLETLSWLQYFRDWKRIEEAKTDHRENAEQAEREITSLIDAGFLAVQGSEFARKQDEYLERWQWGIFAALFHFTHTDNEFLSTAETVQYQQMLLAASASPRLEWSKNTEKVKLPSPYAAGSSDLMRLFAKRRTNRTNTQHAISKLELAACLYAGLGITGHVETPTGWLPLSMTPSGGARNPFEAYVVVNRGRDIESGIYHYSALNHELEIERLGTTENTGRFLAEQDWANGMSATIILVAVFERTMWKYRDGAAYRVVMIEAGHIAQNIMLMATHLGLTACPTAALCHGPIGDLLGLNELTTTPVYALTIDKAGPYADNVRPNNPF
jgi:SagB-type dehydrogenase family enzyme